MYSSVDKTIVAHGRDFDAIITSRNREGDECFQINVFRKDRDGDEPGGMYEYELSVDDLAEKLGIPHIETLDHESKM